MKTGVRLWEKHSWSRLKSNAVKHQQLFFCKQMIAGFGIASTLLLAIGIISYRTETAMIADYQAVLHSHQVLQKLAQILSQMKDIETGQRSYTITGEKFYLEPYNVAIKVIEPEVQELKELIAANPNQQRQFNTLKWLTAQQLTLSQKMIDSRHNGEFEFTQQIVMIGKGKSLMDQIRRVIHQMETQENHLLSKRSLAVEVNARHTNFTFSSAILLTFLILLNIYYFIYRESDKRKRVEIALSESEKRFKTFMNNSPVMAFIKDEQGRYVYVNQPLERVFDVKLADLQGKTDFDWLPEKTAQHVYENDMAVFSTGKTTQIIETVPTPDGSLHYWLVFKFLIQEISGGQLLGGVAVDITERQLAEEELQKTTALQSAILASSNYIIISTTVDGTITTFNTAAEQCLGYTSQEVVGKTTPILFHDHDQILHYAQTVSQELGDTIEPGFEVFVAQARHKTTAEREWVYIRKDGSRFPVLLSVTALRDSQDHIIGFLAIANNITERQKMQATLQTEREFLQAVLENINVGVVACDHQGNLTLFNQATTQFHGLPQETIPPQQWAEQYNLYLPDGKTLMQPEQIPLLRAFRGEEVNNVEMMIVPKHGLARTLLVSGQGLRGSNGAINGAVVAMHDITELKQTEEKIKASLQEKEILLKEIHHRVKNNLQIIDSLFRHQCRNITEKHTIEILQECQNRVKSMALLHEKLYQSEDLAKIAIAAYIQSLVGNLSDSYSLNGNLFITEININQIFLDIETALPCGLIINELVSNCFKYAFPTGKGKINIDFYTVTPHKFRLIVKDNGIGLPANFDFYNTKSLGLKLVRSLVRQLGGTIEINSSGGTEFIIEFIGERNDISK